MANSRDDETEAMKILAVDPPAIEEPFEKLHIDGDPRDKIPDKEWKIKELNRFYGRARDRFKQNRERFLCCITNLDHILKKCEPLEKKLKARLEISSGNKSDLIEKEKQSLFERDATISKIEKLLPELKIDRKQLVGNVNRIHLAIEQLLRRDLNTCHWMTVFARNWNMEIDELGPMKEHAEQFKALDRETVRQCTDELKNDAHRSADPVIEKLVEHWNKIMHEQSEVVIHMFNRVAIEVEEQQTQLKKHISNMVGFVLRLERSRQFMTEKKQKLEVEFSNKMKRYAALYEFLGCKPNPTVKNDETIFTEHV